MEGTGKHVGPVEKYNRRHGPQTDDCLFRCRRWAPERRRSPEECPGKSRATMASRTAQSAGELNKVYTLLKVTGIAARMRCNLILRKGDAGKLAVAANLRKERSGTY